MARSNGAPRRRLPEIDDFNDFHYEEREERMQRPSFTRENHRPLPKANKNVHVNTVDPTVYLTVTMLVIIGVVMVFSASYQMAAIRPVFGNNPFFFLREHGIFAVAGFIAMNIISRISPQYIKNFAFVMYVVTLGLLVAVIVFGIAVGGAGRWIELPVIGRFQPSEISKATLIFMLAFMVDKYPNALKTWTNLIIYVGVVGIVVGLILIPGGFSTALIVGTVGIAMIFVASHHVWRFIVPGGLGVALVGGYLWFDMVAGGGFRGARVQAWMDPWSDYLGVGFQTIQSLYAVATGGWFGLGIGQSRQASFIPEPQNDMIFAIIVEELGLLGASLILILFGIFIWRGIVIAMNAHDTFSSMVAIGIVFAIAFQMIINVAVVTNTIPNTGVTLPFISYGGTSLMVSMAMAGVLLSISRYSKIDNKKTRS